MELEDGPSEEELARLERISKTENGEEIAFALQKER
jgi:hypothetical protein